MDKLILSLVSFVLCFIPTWLYLLVKWILSPEGFWQNIILFGVGVWILGSIQVILFIIFIYLLIRIWSEVGKDG